MSTGAHFTQVKRPNKRICRCSVYLSAKLGFSYVAE
jgi:hypothetical protein